MLYNYQEGRMQIKVGVIGTGTLGPSIAQVFAQCDQIEKVYLCKGRESSKCNGKDAIEKRFKKLISKGKIEQSTVDMYLSKIEISSKFIVKDADFIIEAVAEDLEIKKSVFKELDKICKPDCIFATNTSSLPIKEIYEGLSRPIIGMHFFNPVSAMKLIEIIVTDETPQGNIEFLIELAKLIGKNPVEVRETPGFIVNRILIPMINEAISIYAEGVASVEDIDTAMMLGANHPLGPLALGDLIGLDVVLAIMEVMLKETGDVKYRPESMLKRMVCEKKLGRKTGEGFYKYEK